MVQKGKPIVDQPRARAFFFENQLDYRTLVPVRAYPVLQMEIIPTVTPKIARLVVYPYTNTAKEVINRVVTIIISLGPFLTIT